MRVNRDQLRKELMIETRAQQTNDGSAQEMNDSDELEGNRRRKMVYKERSESQDIHGSLAHRDGGAYRSAENIFLLPAILW
jgi:hypothetical protein